MKTVGLDIADLLADETFLNYCRKCSPTDAAFWEEFILAHPDRRALVEYAKENFSDLFNALAQMDLDEQVDLLNARIEQVDTATVISMNHRLKDNTSDRFRRLVVRISVAAIVLLTAGVFTVSHYLNAHKINPSKTFASSCGERKNIQLPDGSIVTLNAASKIEIDDSFGISSRNVYLEGEAFFDVKHNSKLPFIVHTPVMDVRALGTAFDVKAYLNDKITETSLIRGVVEVTLKKSNNRVMLLYPNQKIRWDNRHVQPGAIDSHQTQRPSQPNMSDSLVVNLKLPDSLGIREIAWKENRLVFEDETLEEIAMSLGRWYGVNIHFKDDSIRAYRFTGMFEKEDLTTVLDFLKESRHFTYSIDNEENLMVNLSK